MADVMQYREVRQRFSVRDDDGPDEDLLPDRHTVTGVVEFEPRLPKGDVLVYPEEFVKPLPITGRIIAGELYANWVESDQEAPRPLHLPVTVDDRADQTWSWIMRVASLSVDGLEQQIKWGDREFQVEAGEGPLYISQVTGDRKGGTITVRGPRGYGITDITADSGVVTVEWEGGDDVEIPIPTAAVATPTSDGLMPRADKQMLDERWWYWGLALPTMDYKTMREGTYQVLGPNTATPMGLPVPAYGWLTVSPSGNRATPRVQRRVVFSTLDDRANGGIGPQTWEISNDRFGSWDAAEWVRTSPVDFSGANPLIQESTANAARHELLKDEQFNHVGGITYTNGRTPVALTWDDFPADFRDRIVPKLREHGLVATLALPSRILEEPHASRIGGLGITWPEIDAWVAEGIIEVANHSATHLGASTREGIYDEIVTARDELEAQTPSGRIFTWIQPSVVYDEGFNNGASAAAWADTYAGQTILGHHALVTGTRSAGPSAGTVAHGSPTQGQKRYWIDMDLQYARNVITSVYGTGRGVMLGAHANRPGMPDRPTQAEMDEFLDWVAGERDAGRIQLLTASQYAWADTRPPRSYESGTVRLNDLIHTDQGWELGAANVDVSRSGSVVTMSAANLRVTEAATGYRTVITLPYGFKPSMLLYPDTWRGTRATLSTDGTLSIQNPGTSSDYVSLSYVTGDLPPAA